MSGSQLLDAQTFASTMIPPMRLVQATDGELATVWSYARPVLAELYPGIYPEDWEIERIYESGGGRYRHVLMPADEPNVYLVFVVDLPNDAVLGHHRLDLAELMGR